MATKKMATKPAPQSNPNAMPVVVDVSETMERALASMAGEGLSTTAYLLQRFNGGTLGELHLGECVGALQRSVKAVQESGEAAVKFAAMP